jgi:multimeric flavodoxin WrbA
MDMGETDSGLVLGIVGSPRRGGNTDLLVEAVLEGARSAGARTEKIALRDLSIGPCLGCDSCRKTGKCAQKDDMRGLLEKMEASDVWVLGTPVYYWGPSAQLKAFVDRWYGAGKAARFAGRRVILALALGSTETYDARHAVGMLKDSLAHQKSDLVGTVIATGVFDKAEIRSHTEVLEKAASAGRRAVEKGRGLTK